MVIYILYYIGMAIKLAIRRKKIEFKNLKLQQIYNIISAAARADVYIYIYIYIPIKYNNIIDTRH